MNKNTTYITNGITQDGFGARMHRAIHTMAFTFFIRDTYNLNVDYIHTPFSYEGFGENFSLLEKERQFACNVPHGDPYGEVSRDGYLKRAILWDKHINYTGKTINDVDFKKLNIVNVKDIGKGSFFNDISKGNFNNKLYIIKYLQKEFNSGVFDVNIVDKYYSEIRKRFLIDVDESNNDIILQIRRKDAFKFGNVRYLEDNYYLEILNELSKYRDKYNISIHTQRSGFDSAKYSDWNVFYDDQEQDYDLFKRMVGVRVLVVGKTSFSVSAAFLNKNIIVFPNDMSGKLNRYINKRNFIKLIKENKIINNG